MIIVKDVFGADIATLLDEKNNPSTEGKYIKSFKTTWVESESEEIIPVNFDGEPYRNKKIRFEIVPSAIDLVLPVGCPCLK